jgi:hypothetical protein
MNKLRKFLCATLILPDWQWMPAWLWEGQIGIEPVRTAVLSR